MEQIIDFITNLTGISVSLFLMMLVVLDTLMAMLARLKRKVGMLSNSLGKGIIVKCGIAFVPALITWAAYGIDIVGRVSSQDVMLINFSIWVIGVFITIGEIVSIISYFRVAYPTTTTILANLADKLAPAEIKAKLDKLGLSDILDGIKAPDDIPAVTVPTSAVPETPQAAAATLTADIPVAPLAIPAIISGKGE